jgi:hypothetical protein
VSARCARTLFVRRLSPTLDCMGLIALSERTRCANLMAALVLAAGSIGLIFALGLPVLSVFTVSIVAAVWMALLAWIFIDGFTRKIYFDSGKRQIIVRWRNVLLLQREACFPLERFGSVVSYYPKWEKSPQNIVSLVERSSGCGLAVTSFGTELKWRSFWTIVPKLVEAPGAQALRAKIHSTLGLADEGFVGLRKRLRRCK